MTNNSMSVDDEGYPKQVFIAPVVERALLIVGRHLLKDMGVAFQKTVVERLIEAETEVVEDVEFITR